MSEELEVEIQKFAPVSIRKREDRASGSHSLLFRTRFPFRSGCTTRGHKIRCIHVRVASLNKAFSPAPFFEGSGLLCGQAEVHRLAGRCEYYEPLRMWVGR